MQHHFFISPASFNQPAITLTGDQAHQVRRVLRMRVGDRAVLLDGQGGACEASLTAVNAADVCFQVARRWTMNSEPATHITLYQAVLKGERFGWALQKGTEVGVSAFVPLICAVNVVDDRDAADGKRERWARILQEAAEQSGRGRLPELGAAALFAQAVQPAPPAPLPAREGGAMPPSPAGGEVGEDALPSPARRGVGGEVRLILWEGEHEARLRDVLAFCNVASGARIQLFVGPEGGFTEDEVALARRHGVQPVTLGPRILRAETAGVIAAALILYETGDI